MKKIFYKALEFIRENPKVLPSFFLVVAIPLVIFIHSRMIISSFEKNIDTIIQAEAVLVENIITYWIGEKIENEEELQSLIKDIVEKNERVASLSILKSSDGGQKFYVFSSDKEELIGSENSGIQNLLAWNTPEGIATLGFDENGRYWNVVKSIHTIHNEKIGLISMNFSLRESDLLIEKTLNNSFWILVATIGIVLLLMANQIRLFQYVFLAQKLREIDRMKDMFISMASHELRSPLTAIKGNIEFLKEKQEETLADKESRYFLENINISVNRLDDLVDDMLDVSRIEGNRIPIKLVLMEPKDIIESSLREMQPYATKKGLDLSLTSYEAGNIFVDSDRLKQILVNLVGNAIKYTETGSVKVSTKIKNKEYLIMVADTGFGISSEDQKKLFLKFSRIQNGKTQGIKGTGLGLWITQELAQKMNAHISLESIEGVGSHFSICFPLKRG
ncbi:MAG: HAMP domain-containing histidine kinase [Candidatus Moraniibacteriota bacterium]|nr:MAG: HAMP domain-containing histidine kinase [Candidatus Moranbacteria bacterium]